MNNPFESMMRQLMSPEPKDSAFKSIKEQMHDALATHQGAEKTLSFALNRGLPNEQVQMLKKQMEQDLEEKGTEMLAMACELYDLAPEPSSYGTLSLLLIRRLVGERPPPRAKWSIDVLIKLEQDFNQALESGAKTQLDAWKQLAQDPYWQRQASDIRHNEPEKQRSRPEEILTLAKTLRTQLDRSKRQYGELQEQIQRQLNSMRGGKG